jgi:hypothetical protein
MKILSERTYIEDAFESIMHAAASSNWATAIYTKEQKEKMLAELSMLSPETVTRKQIIDIVDSMSMNGYTCFGCGARFFDGVGISFSDDSCEICKSCIDLAHEQLKIKELVL